MVVYGRAEVEKSKLYVDGNYMSDFIPASLTAYGPFQNVAVIGDSEWQDTSSSVMADELLIFDVALHESRVQLLAA